MHSKLTQLDNTTQNVTNVQQFEKGPKDEIINSIPIENDSIACNINNNILQLSKRPNININTNPVIVNIHSPRKSPVQSPKAIANNKNSIKSPKTIKDISNNKKLSPHKLKNSNSTQNTINNNEFKKGFIVPSFFITRYSFYGENLGYMFGNGTVGVCFKNDTRIVMDPNEKFAQFYKNANSKHEIIDFEEYDEQDKFLKFHDSIQLVQKIARNFKKIRFSFKVEKYDYDSTIPLHNVSCYAKTDDSILFKLSNQNIQINFKDYKKMIIFWNIKKMCFFQNFREKCNLLDMNDADKLELSNDELKKYEISREMLSNLEITI